MDTNKLQFLTDRSATIGGKLATKLGAGKIPNAAEMAFFSACIDQLAKVEPAHALRTLALELREAVTAAKAKRSLWLKGRDEALRQAKARMVAKARARKVASVAEFTMPAAALPTRTNKQGLPFVVQLPLEWQNAAVA